MVNENRSSQYSTIAFPAEVLEGRNLSSDSSCEAWPSLSASRILLFITPPIGEVLLFLTLGH